jgi:hypothetical protein
LINLSFSWGERWHESSTRTKFYLSGLVEFKEPLGNGVVLPCIGFICASTGE